MTDPDTARFFGYGSLVNRATHDYAQAYPAHLPGWRRVWVQTPTRPLAYLSVQRDATCTIAGLVAEVPGGNWAALDEREAAYTRLPVAAFVAGAPLGVQVYAVPTDPAPAPAPQTAPTILLSYLDVVVQGFLREFGTEGAGAFFATTVHWGPILNDRAAPRYPRAQRLSTQEISAVDEGLHSLGARIIS